MGQPHREIVGYDNIQFTKAPNVLRGMGLANLTKNESAKKGVGKKGHGARAGLISLASLTDLGSYPLIVARQTSGPTLAAGRRFMSPAYFEEQRREMIAAIRVIAEQVVAEFGKTALDDRVLRAMGKVPRHEFVPLEVQPYAYLNRPLPIGFEKTISQPLMVAVMTDLLELKRDDVVLEIGTGLGYQSAVLAELAGSVYTVEIIDELAQRAVQRLKREGYTKIEVRVGNGYFGWPEHAPFDKVIVTASPDLTPPPLINQLKAGGRMVIPVGLPDAQQLLVIDKDVNGKVRTKEIMQVLFSLLDGPDEPSFRAS